MEVEALRVELVSGNPIIEDVTFTLAPGEVLGLVGESGCGKTTTALALLGYASRGTSIADGRVTVADQEVIGRSQTQVRNIRGSLVSYVPQDPSTALNPSFRIGDQIADMLRAHGQRRDVEQRVVAALERVQLPIDREFRKRYPHQLSGGQQQRVVIAKALVTGSPIAVFDEPTTGLDVVTQARLLEQLQRLKQEIGLAVVYVSHDLAVVAQIADSIAVMYAGHVVEDGPAAEVLRRPLHPYTWGLMTSIPDHAAPRRLRAMPGLAVGVEDRPPGCRFEPRCPQRIPECAEALPPLEIVRPGYGVRCIRWDATPPLALEPVLVPNRQGSALGPVLQVESLCACHRSRRQTVTCALDLSFSVDKGECVALVGESGSGKTTIARCVAGLHVPTSGTILLDGAPLRPLARQRSVSERRAHSDRLPEPYGLAQSAPPHSRHRRSACADFAPTVP